MRPVISKVRVGDVLLGTKNLRNYLRTCSLLRYFRALDRKVGQKEDPKSLLYTPGKQDPFVVAINNHDKFAVWSPNKDVILMFINHPSSELYVARKSMDPDIFAQWFVRTTDKNPDVAAWPRHAYFLWAALHMNAWRNPERSLQVRFNNCRMEEEYDLPFAMAKSLGVDGVDNPTIAEAVRESVTRGVFRNLPNSRKTSPQIFGGSNCGPSLKDLPRLRRNLESYAKNSRLISKARTQKELDLSFLMNIKENSL